MELYQSVTALTNRKKMLILGRYAFLIFLFQNTQTKPIHVVCHKFSFYDVFTFLSCNRFFYYANSLICKFLKGGVVCSIGVYPSHLLAGVFIVSEREKMKKILKRNCNGRTRMLQMNCL